LRLLDTLYRGQIRVYMATSPTGTVHARRSSHDDIFSTLEIVERRAAIVQTTKQASKSLTCLMVDGLHKGSAVTTQADTIR
jgi:hypothetical protein